ncbi:MAG: histidine phosphatase family protein [Gammaproteobacteria bacterium]|jgi:broad specificity phosphatase PhoE
MPDKNSAKYIFLARHGETVWNHEHRLQGRRNSPLTQRGREQAFQLAERLEKKRIGAIYTSPLGRAVETAEIVGQHLGLEPLLSANLGEIDLGPWEGMTRSETRRSDPDQNRNFWHRPEAFSLPGAETFQQLQNRVVMELERLFSMRDNASVLVISHWIAMKTALAHFRGIPLSRLGEMPDPGNARFLTLSKDGGKICVCENPRD